MSPDVFFELFLKELEGADHLHSYYKFHNNRRSFLFRKNYFLRRLEFIYRHAGEPGNRIWDVGCGFGTTAIFLAINKHHVHGSTLEFYLDHVEQRLKFWANHGDLGYLSLGQENLFDLTSPGPANDRIIVQDTLHHLEPIEEGIHRLFSALKHAGKLIVVEENGNALAIRVPMYLYRGNKRTVMVFDEKLGKEVLMGNENVRDFTAWNDLFLKQGLQVSDLEYIRYFLPPFWSHSNYSRRVAQEKKIWERSKLKRESFFMGMNFVVSRGVPVRNSDMSARIR